MIYCIEAWGNASNCYLDQLYIIQKKVIRLISFTNYDIPSAVTFKNLEILPLNKLVYNRIGIMMYKYSNNLLPPAINDLYVSNNDVHKYSTRQNHLLYVNKSNINVYAKSFGNISVRVWNVLQFKIDVNVPISKFQKSSKNYLQDNSLVSKYTEPQLNYYITTDKNHFFLSFIHYSRICISLCTLLELYPISC